MIELHIEPVCEWCENAWSNIVLLGATNSDTNKAMCLPCFRKLLELAKTEVAQKMELQ